MGHRSLPPHIRAVSASQYPFRLTGQESVPLSGSRPRVVSLAHMGK